MWSQPPLLSRHSSMSGEGAGRTGTRVLCCSSPTLPAPLLYSFSFPFPTNRTIYCLERTCEMEGRQEEAAVCPPPHLQHWGRGFPFVTGCKPPRNGNKTPQTRGYGCGLLLCPGNCYQRGSPEEITRGGGSREQPAGGRAAAEPSGAVLSSRVKFPKLMDDTVQALPPSGPGVTASPAPPARTHAVLMRSDAKWAS